MQFNKRVILFDIDYTLFNLDLFKESLLKEYELYEEVEEVLSKLSKFVKLGIFSEGNYKFQKTKLEKTNLKNYFKDLDTHIVEDKLRDLRRILGKYKNKRIFFVDDKLTILCDAKKILPSIFTVWLKRGIYAMNQKKIANFKPNAVVANLREVVRIVSQDAEINSA